MRRKGPLISSSRPEWMAIKKLEQSILSLLNFNLPRRLYYLKGVGRFDHLFTEKAVVTCLKQSLVALSLLDAFLLVGEDFFMNYGLQMTALNHDSYCRYDINFIAYSNITKTVKNRSKVRLVPLASLTLANAAMQATFGAALMLQLVCHVAIIAIKTRRVESSRGKKFSSLTTEFCRLGWKSERGQPTSGSIPGIGAPKKKFKPYPIPSSTTISG